MSKIYSYWRERPQCLTHPSPEASSRSPGSENDISWSWSEQKRVQQLLFFYPDNEVTIITLVFFFIFSLQLCHSFYNFFTILQFRKQFHYSDKTALNIGTTPFLFHVHWFLRLQPTCTCSRTSCSALALAHHCLHLHLANWPCARALALGHQQRDLHLLLPSLLQVVQHLPIVWKTHHLHSCLARITGNISLLRGNHWDLRLVFFKQKNKPKDWSK